MRIHKKAENYPPACRQKIIAATPGRSKFTRGFVWLFTPVLAPVLQSKMLIFALLGLGIGQVALVALGLVGWRCPILSTLDIPCPGCGLTTAVALLLKGEWMGAVRMHAFAPPVAIAFFVMFVAGIAPTKYQHSLSSGIAAFERHTGIAAIGLISMVAYWLLRVIEII